MGSARSKGTLKKWFDDKGFGFIVPAKGSKDVFVHISAFDRNIPRRPEVGDTIYYHTKADNKGKVKAVDAAIEGVSPVTTRIKPKPRKHNFRERNNSWKLLVLTVVLLVGGGSTLYSRFQSTGHILPSSSEVSRFVSSSPGNSSSAQYTCSGKTHCSQMSSCAEAEFYIQNCPNTEMDGDGDGVPCEHQWCN